MAKHSVQSSSGRKDRQAVHHTPKNPWIALFMVKMEMNVKKQLQLC